MARNNLTDRIFSRLQSITGRMRMRVLDQIRVLVEQDHIFRINHLFLFNASTFAFWQIVYFKLPVVGKELQNQFNSDSFRNSCTTLFQEQYV